MTKDELNVMLAKIDRAPKSRWFTERDALEARAIQEWAKDLDKDAAKYDAGDDFGYDDSEEFRWEHEYQRKSGVSASHVYVPNNFADCYESEIMGRQNGWIERSEG